MVETIHRVDPVCLEIRRANFPNRIDFFAPGLKRYRTAEYAEHDASEFVSLSITGTSCALNCEHCKMQVLRGMADLSSFNGSLYALCEQLKHRGAKGVLVSGGSDLKGRVPLLPHIPDLIRARKELGMVLRVHPGLPDEETCAGLAEADIDGAMVDIIGHEDTMKEVYHLDGTPDDYDAVLERLERHGVPTVPHIILGLHFGRMVGEWKALEMVANHPPKLLVLVILMPLSGTPMSNITPPSLGEIGGFFESARRKLRKTPVVLGCARPLGEIKPEIDRLAVDAGLNGIAYPSDGIVDYANSKHLESNFVNACCGVTW